MHPAANLLAALGTYSTRVGFDWKSNYIRTLTKYEHEITVDWLGELLTGTRGRIILSLFLTGSARLWFYWYSCNYWPVFKLTILQARKRDYTLSFIISAPLFTCRNWPEKAFLPQDTRYPVGQHSISFTFLGPDKNTRTRPLWTHLVINITIIKTQNGYKKETKLIHFAFEIIVDVRIDCSSISSSSIILLFWNCWFCGELTVENHVLLLAL
jgi:hypothetical protein